MFYVMILLVQLSVTLIMGVYFYRQLKAQNGGSPTHGQSGCHREMERLAQMKRVRLTEPLSEKARPSSLQDIVGQEDGVTALKAILCSENPQHVIIYGPPGIGKTCAARLVLDFAKGLAHTPFLPNAPFIEMDATCVRYDERAIADPLIGSVHDPIYQGAGQLGVNGVPQPKEGAVTRAHGGVLFLDEIGELQPIQMNKLLKVLEDRKVRFESAYYNPEDARTPRYIHEVFQHGLPADFRLIGATTRAPEELPPALRSRCMEVFFRALEPEELAKVASGAAEKFHHALDAADADLVGRHSASGRDAVNIVQMAAGVAQLDGRNRILRKDVEWVLDCGHYAPRIEPEKAAAGCAGLVNGLAVHGAHQGAVMRIEAVASPGAGRLRILGIVDEEELPGGGGQKLRRTSTARAAAENAMTLLRALGEPVADYDLHFNFPGGMPVDGPSAGVAMTVAAWSALHRTPVACDLAFTGEISVHGAVLPVGGVPEKIEAARKAGLKRVIIPAANAKERYRALGIAVYPVADIEEALRIAAQSETAPQTLPAAVPDALTAKAAVN